MNRLPPLRRLFPGRLREIVAVWKSYKGGVPAWVRFSDGFVWWHEPRPTAWDDHPAAKHKQFNSSERGSNLKKRNDWIRWRTRIQEGNLAVFIDHQRKQRHYLGHFVYWQGVGIECKERMAIAFKGKRLCAGTEIIYLVWPLSYSNLIFFKTLLPGAFRYKGKLYIIYIWL